MITFFHISHNLTGKWNFDIDFFQVLTCCNISNSGLIKQLLYFNFTFVKTTFSDLGGLKT